MTAYEHEELGRLIAVLRPAPAGWVAAAKELPAARATIEGIVTRALADAAYRARVLADLESALAEAGIEPTPPILDELRGRFRSS